MLFELTHRLPDKCVVAVSGGVDSMCALYWLLRGSCDVKGVVHISHNTPFSTEAKTFVQEVCSMERIPCREFAISKKPPKNKSLEEFWRDQRYKVFDKFNTDVVLAHNMDDCLEEYIMATMIRGYPGTIPYRHGQCIRPFRQWTRASITNYARKNNIPYLEDPSNEDVSFKRNFIRHEIVPKIKMLNPGIYKIVKKAIDRQDQFDKAD